MQHKIAISKPTFQAHVTVEQVTAALAAYLDHRPVIKEQARMCDDRAVSLMGAYLGYLEQPNYSAGAWLVYQVAMWQFFNPQAATGE